MTDQHQFLKETIELLHHGLEEPVRRIHGFTHLAIQAREEDDVLKLDENLAFAHEACERMQARLQGIVHLARIDSGEFAAETLDSRAVLEHALLRHHEEHPDSLVDIGEMPPVRGDAKQIGALFGILLSNAAIACRPGKPHIEVSGEALEYRCVFRIRDHGRGLDEHQRATAFELFRSCHPNWPGEGIGLALAERIVDRHFGRIAFEPIDGTGACIRFDLPEAGK